MKTLFKLTNLWPSEIRTKTKPQHRELRALLSEFPKMHGLPKVHKAGRPFRPIVSSVITPTVAILPLRWHILANFDQPAFADWAKTYKLNNGIMCSLDITSLYYKCAT